MYLKGMLHMKLNIPVDSLTTIRWYIDASYGVHSDCKAHTGMMMMLGAGASITNVQINCIEIISLSVNVLQPITTEI